LVVPLGELGWQESLQVLSRGVAEGAWHWTRHWQFKGVALILVWLAEAALVIGGSALVALVPIELSPYCDRCRTWMRGPQRVGSLRLRRQGYPSDAVPEWDDEDMGDELDDNRPSGALPSTSERVH
jgi:hypothetical protein